MGQSRKVPEVGRHFEHAARSLKQFLKQPLWTKRPRLQPIKILVNNANLHQLYTGAENLLSMHHASGNLVVCEDTRLSAKQLKVVFDNMASIPSQELLLRQFVFAGSRITALS